MVHEAVGHGDGDGGVVEGSASAPGELVGGDDDSGHMALRPLKSFTTDQLVAIQHERPQVYKEGPCVPADFRYIPASPTPS